MRNKQLVGVIIWAALMTAFLVLIIWLALSSIASAHSTDWRTTEQLLDDIRQCESEGNYSAINDSKTEQHFDGVDNSYGAYQFGQGTWDWVAAKSLYPWLKPYPLLVGLRPDKVPAPWQDRIAAKLVWLETHDDQDGVGNYSWSHWGNC